MFKRDFQGKTPILGNRNGLIINLLKGVVTEILDEIRMGRVFELTDQSADTLLKEGGFVPDSGFLFLGRLDLQGLACFVDSIDHPAVRLDEIDGASAAFHGLEIQVK